MANTGLRSRSFLHYFFGPWMRPPQRVTPRPLASSFANRIYCRRLLRFANCFQGFETIQGHLRISICPSFRTRSNRSGGGLMKVRICLVIFCLLILDCSAAYGQTPKKNDRPAEWEYKQLSSPSKEGWEIATAA